MIHHVTHSLSTWLSILLRLNLLNLDQTRQRLPGAEWLEPHAFPASTADSHLFFERVDGGFNEARDVRVTKHVAVLARGNDDVLGGLRGRPHIGALEVKHLGGGLDELGTIAEIKVYVLFGLRRLTSLPRGPIVELVDQLQHFWMLHHHKMNMDFGAGG